MISQWPVVPSGGDIIFVVGAKYTYITVQKLRVFKYTEGNLFCPLRQVYDMRVCCCGPGGRWWQPTTGSMTMHAVTCRLTA